MLQIFIRFTLQYFTVISWLLYDFFHGKRLSDLNPNPWGAVPISHHISFLQRRHFSHWLFAGRWSQWPTRRWPTAAGWWLSGWRDNSPTFGHFCCWFFMLPGSSRPPFFSLLYTFCTLATAVGLGIKKSTLHSTYMHSSAIWAGLNRVELDFESSSASEILKPTKN